MTTALYRVKVQWGDCDGARIVFYPNFFRWFDEATRNLFETHGLYWAAMIDRWGTRGVPMVDTGATFKSPARFGDTLLIETALARWGTRSFDIRHVARVGDRVAVEARETRIWGISDPANAEGLKAGPIPAEVMALMPAAPT